MDFKIVFKLFNCLFKKEKKPTGKLSISFEILQIHFIWSNRKRLLQITNIQDYLDIQAVSTLDY